MQIKSPIFVTGFQRGGTNILINLIRSHPDIVWMGETHMLFYGQEGDTFFNQWVSRALYVPVLIAARQHIFWINRLDERRKLPTFMLNYIDALFSVYRSRKEEFQNHREHKNLRLLFKNVNALSLATGIFAEMYPDATFIGLVRNGLALCEGFMRRGWTVDRFAQMYSRVCEQMIEDAKNRSNYHIIRFEDIISDPETAIPTVYGWAGLDLEPGQKFRLQAKKSMDKDGKRKYMFGGSIDKESRWFALNEVQSQFRRDVNENQINRLSESDREKCLSQIGDLMQPFGYLETFQVGQ